jgi:hypothetical protein
MIPNTTINSSVWITEKPFCLIVYITLFTYLSDASIELEFLYSSVVWNFSKSVLDMYLLLPPPITIWNLSLLSFTMVSFPLKVDPTDIDFVLTVPMKFTRGSILLVK